MSPLVLALAITLVGPLLLAPLRPLDDGANLAALKLKHPEWAHPMKPDTASVAFCFALLALPLPVLGALIAYQKRLAAEFHAAMLCVIQGGALQHFFVELGKELAVRYRPDFLARCESIDARGLCINADPHLVSESHKSFPSGTLEMQSERMKFELFQLICQILMIAGQNAE